MKLLLKRKFRGTLYTMGDLYIDNKFFCNVIEDVDRNLNQTQSVDYIKSKKIYGLTAIPTGTYNIDMNTVSPKYSNFTKYPYTKEFDGKMPRLLNVKGWDGILIHPGNTQLDSLGCLIVGINNVKGMVTQSQDTWKKLMRILLTDKNNITITIE